MDAFVTNRGKYLFLEWSLYQQNLPTTFYYAMIAQGSSDVDSDTDVMSHVTEIAAGNGYTSGGVSFSIALGNGASLTEDDVLNRAYSVLRNVTAAEASGGSIPTSGGACRYGVITTDEATVANRQIIAFFDLDPSGETGWTIPDAKKLVIQGHQIKLETP